MAAKKTAKKAAKKAAQTSRGDSPPAAKPNVAVATPAVTTPVEETPKQDAAVTAPVAEDTKPVRKVFQLNSRARRYLQMHLKSVAVSKWNLDKLAAAIEEGKTVAVLRDGAPAVEEIAWNEPGRLLAKYGNRLITSYPEQMFTDRVIRRP